MSFSPTGGTLDRVMLLASVLRQELGAEGYDRSYTLPVEREVPIEWQSGDLLLWGSPVYAGRLPNRMTDYVVRTLCADGLPFVGLVTYGNRSEGDALAELVGIARRGGCVPVGAVAVVMPHAFSPHIAGQRPTADDDTALIDFGRCVAERLKQGIRPIAPFGNECPQSFYTPLRADGQPASFLKAKPTVDDKRCVRCGKCAEVCPMGSIAMREGPVFEGLCIKCQACVMRCPNKALAVQHPDYLSHVAMLEEHYSEPNRNIFIL